MAKKVAVRRRRRVDLTEHAEASVSDAVESKLRPLYKIAVPLVGIMAFVGAIVGGWKTIGGPVPVFDHALQVQLDAMRSDMTSKLETMKTETQRRIDGLAGKVDRLTVSGLENQQRTLFLQKQNMQSNLASIDNQLRQHPDEQFYEQRKVELTNLIQYLDREANSVQDQLTRARSGQPDGR